MVAGRRIHASAGIERLTVINGLDRESTAVSGGLDYTRSANFNVVLAKTQWVDVVRVEVGMPFFPKRHIP